MQFSRWIKQSGKTRKAIAEEIGVSPAYITALCANSVWPGKAIASRIQRVTEGAVTANDFLGSDAA